MDLDIWLTADVPDTDLLAQLYLIYPDGHAHALTETVMRARYRNSLEQAEPIHQGQPEKYHFSPGWWFGMRASAGSRLRLIVSSLNDPAFEKNYNSMKTVEEQTGADARVGHIQLLQDAQHPSVLTVPLGDPKAPCRNSATW